MNLLKPFGTESFILGIGIAAVSYLLGPTIKRGAKGVAVKGMQGALMAGDAANEAMDTGRDKFSDFIQGIMNDGNNNVMDQDNDFQKELFNELKAERQQYSELMKELVSSVKSLQGEVSELKKSAATTAQATKATAQAAKTTTKTSTTK
ncbi:hypothetical protein R9X47_04445 [Wukongibacter baidiensis]|uniref:hypothetical protein n=1 Tax=Wukongibacter baidiensis TaxID=1723361 RepID=UPI003D7F847F